MGEVDIKLEEVIPVERKKSEFSFLTIDQIRSKRIAREKEMRGRMRKLREGTRTPNSEWLNRVLDVDKSG